MNAGSNRPVDFFISYSPADERWATWIGWQLETAGYRTVIQAWDFVPGTNFIDFMDKGVSEADVVVAVLSRNYLNSRYGRLEWQAALRADPDNPANKLVTVRVEDCTLTGLLSMITYVDLVGVTDPRVARARLLEGIGHALAGRAKPEHQPPSPFDRRTINGEVAERPAGGALERDATPPSQPPARRTPVTAPQYPAQPGVAARGTRPAVTLLHVPGPRFGRGLARVGADELQARIWGDLTRLGADGAPHPDVLLVTGDLTESGSPRQFDEALSFLTGLRVLLGLEPHRLVVVPGAHDLTLAACRAYFASCEADDVPPQPPYWPKWRHYARMFGDLYQGLDGPLFDSFQPWTLFALPDLRLVVAGLNSTVADSHREDDHYGWIGETQAAWFARQLRPFEEAGWLRVGAVSHRPVPAGAPPRPDPALLRDTGTLDRLLGPRLNLLVHGGASTAGGPPGDAVDEAPSGLAVVPPPARADYQLLELAADGLTRWRGAAVEGDGAAPEPDRLVRRWVAAGTTYSGVDGDQSAAGVATGALGGPPNQLGGASPADVDPTDPADVPDPTDPTALSEVDDGAEGAAGEGTGASDPRQPDPTSLLLDRVAEVCHTRYERARVHRLDGEPPSLLVVYLEDGFVRHLRVAAHVGTVTRAEVDAFHAQVHAADPDVVSELVFQGPQPPRSLRDEALRRGIRLRSFVEFQGLLDLRGFVEAQTGRLAADRRYPPELYVPQRFKDLVGPNQTIRDGLVEELLRLLSADDGRFVLVLGDFGRGKTFALRELARRLPAELPHLIPILIELRTLDKVHSVDGLVAAHLANQGEELIDLRAFRYMLRQGRIVLLFDGFDELVTRLTYDQAADHLETLLRAAEDKAKIVVTSRTQHFRSHAQVLTALGERVGLLPHRRVLSVEDFTPAQIRTYLVNRYRGDEAVADARLAHINRVQDLFGLAQNPRMLSFIAALDEDRLTAVAHASGTISAAGLYREILQAWLSYEEQRTGVRGSARGLSATDLWQAVTTLAVRLWQTGESFLRPGELSEVADALAGLAESQMSSEQAVYAMGAGSLLIRTDEGMFGFIHSSVVEWLVAHDIARELDGEVPAPRLLSQRPLTQLAVDFLADLADARACREWTHRVLTEEGSDPVARANALKLRARLRTPTWTDLRGAALQGEDLSYRQLQDVDLTGADLTDALLVGANLSRAKLRDARLVGARLDEAVLSGADLSGADLSRARLFRTDLRDVTITGSRWRRAALVDVAAAPALAGTPELHGAAIAPGQPVEVELAPPAVGVPYGFHYRRGRLPRAVAYSPDGDVVAFGNDDGSVVVCDAATGLPLRCLQGHHGRVYAVAYGPAGDFLATGSADGTVRLWDTLTGRCTGVLEEHLEGVWPLVVGPTGTTLVTGAADGVVRVWDVESRTVLRELPGHSAPVYAAVYAPNPRLLLTSDGSGRVRWWDLDTGEVTRTTGSEGSRQYQLRFSPDGTLLATGDRDGVVRVWDAASGELRHELTGHTGRIYALRFHPGGRMLVSGDTDGAVRIWDPLTGRHLRSLPGHAGSVYWARFDPDGTTLVTGDRDGVMYLWDPQTGQRRHEMHGHRGSVWPTAFRRDGRQLASSANDGTARLWDVTTGLSRYVLRGHGRRVMSVSFGPDGTTLATSGNDGVVRLWNPRTGECRLPLTGFADRLISAVFSPSGPLLATASNDGSVYLWNVVSGDYQRELDVGTDHVWAEIFNPDGDVLATANDDDTVRLWYTPTGRQTAALRGHRGRVRSIAFSPDGRVVATGCDDGEVRLFDAASGELVAGLRHHTDRVYSVRYDADGARLVSAGLDGMACLWDARDGRLLTVLSGHRGRLWSVAFAPDGRTVATAGDDRVVRLWDLASGEVAHTLAGHTRRIWSVDFSPDGRLLASAGDDGTARLWDVTDAAAPAPYLTLLGLSEGWAALAPDGRYKVDGDVTGQFWYAVGMCRFEPGELDAYLPAVRQVPREAPF